MLVELGRLESLLDETRLCAEAETSWNERAEFAVAKEREVRTKLEDTTWINEMAAEYRAQAQTAAEQRAELERAIRAETLRQESLAGASIKEQMTLARFLDDRGRDGTAIACRAVLLQPLSAQESLALSGYLEQKGQYREAVTAARQGWQQFGGRALRVQWAELLAKAGPVDDLIQLLEEDLRAAPDDLALMERLARLLTQEGRLPQACAMMVRALAHPAGASRLLSEFMQWLAAAGNDYLAVGLANTYMQRQVADDAGVRREVAETLRANHFLPTAIAFLDDQVASAPNNREVAAYRTTFLVNSLRSGDRDLRQATLALLAERRDDHVEAALLDLYASSRGDELSLLVLNSLVAIQGPEALPFLAQALGSNARRVRLAAARALGQLGAPPSAAAFPRRGESPQSASSSAGRIRPAGGAGDDEHRPNEIGDATPPDESRPDRTDTFAGRGESPQSQSSSAGRIRRGDEIGDDSRRALRILRTRMAVERDEDVRQAIVEALHQADPRPRRLTEQMLGLRPWAVATPRAWPAPRPGDSFRQARNAVIGLMLLAVVLALVLPLRPSPRTEVVQLYQRGAGMLATRQAARHTTPTVALTADATATRSSSAAEMGSGQASDALAADTVRVQLSGQIATVRYIGVDVPAADQPGGHAALDANRNLVIGRMVYLEQGAIVRDSSGRWLRYVWLPEGQMANERLLELGFAAPAADPQDTKYQQRLAEAAAKAWQNKAGFWAGGNDIFPMAAVKAAEANIRGGPNTDQPIKLQVKQGAVFAVLGRSEGSDWVAVRIPNFDTGWIATQVVDTTVRVANLPAVK